MTPPSGPSVSDDALMARVQDGDHIAFARLYDRHAATAFGVARSICQHGPAAEDAVQEGFLSIWRGRAGYRLENGSTFRGWALQIVRNRAIDSRRRDKIRPQASGASVESRIESATGSALDEAIGRDREAELNALLERLPPTQAEVITLAYFGGLSHTEISAKLDLPGGTVKGRIRLGLEKMRRDLGS
jgi:RNA polymerase sigma-70 factor (ECF subfamily)